MSAYEDLIAYQKDTQALAQVMGRLGWDQETVMPRGGADQRAEEMAALEAVLHARRTEPRVGEWLAEAEATDDVARANLRLIRREYERAVKVPADLAKAPLDGPLLGLFSPSHMTYMADRKPDSSEPTLTEMTAAALARLKAHSGGYYLMVEGGRIDHAHHEGRAGYALEETVEMARAVQYAVDNTDPADTLIMVTADHSHVFTIAGYPQRGNDILGLVVPPIGRGEDGGDGGPLMAADGKPYTTLGYANGPGAVQGERQIPQTGLAARQQALVPLGSETHGGEDVALFATGPGSDRVRGVIEQNVIYQIIRKALGWAE